MLPVQRNTVPLRGCPPRLCGSAHHVAAVRRSHAALPCAPGARARRLGGRPRRILTRCGRTRLGRGGRMERCGVPRLLPRRRAAHRGASRSGIAAPRGTPAGRVGGPRVRRPGGRSRPRRPAPGPALGVGDSRGAGRPRPLAGTCARDRRQLAGNAGDRRRRAHDVSFPSSRKRADSRGDRGGRYREWPRRARDRGPSSRDRRSCRPPLCRVRRPVDVREATPLRAPPPPPARSWPRRSRRRCPRARTYDRQRHACSSHA